MYWWAFIFILVMVPSAMPRQENLIAFKKVEAQYPNLHTEINRVIQMVPDRRFLEYDQYDPKQVMKALNSLPGPSNQISQVDMAEYARIEKARIERQRQKYLGLQGKKLPYENFDINKLNQSAVYYLPNNNFKNYYNNITSTIPKNSKKNREYVKRRHHYDKGTLKLIHEIESIPDIEEMLPVEYLAKHKNDFNRFHGSTGKNIPKIRDPYSNVKEPAMQYIEMGSMNSLRKSNVDDLVEAYLRKKRGGNKRTDDTNALHGITFRKSRVDDLVENYLRKKRTGRYNNMKSRKSFEEHLAESLFRQTRPKKKSAISAYFRNVQFRKSNGNDMSRLHSTKKILPALTEEQVNHPGNSLFFITDKRILGAHIFPKKEAKHSVYGNFESLGLNKHPTSEELKLKKLRNIYRGTPPDAQERPWRLYSRNHPGLNLLFEKNMPLEAAKFTKPKSFLVYGNLNNLGKRDKDSDRYAFSDFRRSQYFKRPDSGRFNIRPAREQLSYDSYYEQSNNTQHSRRPPKKSKGSSWTRPGRKVDPFNEMSGRVKPKVLAKIYIGRAATKEDENKKSLKKTHKKMKKGKNVPVPESKENKKTDKYDNETSKKKEKLVYGNINNDMLGIRYGNTPHRWKYTDFRKNNEQRKLFRHYNEDSDAEILLNNLEDNTKPEVIIVRRDKDDSIDTDTLLVAVLPADIKHRKQKYIKYRFLKDYLDGKIHGDENEPKEILETYEENVNDWRRSSKGRLKYTSYESKEKKNNTVFCNDDDDESSESSQSGEKNPGNPYTVFKSKYKQNWLWNHFMDGDHMNVNPYGPKFDSLGPTGNELFFGRKWWYFNQDDYKPFRRR